MIMLIYILQALSNMSMSFDVGSTAARSDDDQKSSFVSKKKTK